MGRKRADSLPAEVFSSKPDVEGDEKERPKEQKSSEADVQDAESGVSSDGAGDSVGERDGKAVDSGVSAEPSKGAGKVNGRTLANRRYYAKKKAEAKAKRESGGGKEPAADSLESMSKWNFQKYPFDR